MKNLLTRTLDGIEHLFARIPVLGVAFVVVFLPLFLVMMYVSGVLKKKAGRDDPFEDFTMLFYISLPFVALWLLIFAYLIGVRVSIN